MSPPITMVAPLGTSTLVVTSVVLVWGMLLMTCPLLRSGWTSIRTMPSLEMNGRTRRSVPTGRKSTCWTVLVVRLTEGGIAQELPELQLGDLLVEHEKARRREHLDFADRLQCPDEARHTVGYKTEFQAVLIGSKTLRASCRPLGLRRSELAPGRIRRPN